LEYQAGCENNVADILLAEKEKIGKCADMQMCKRRAGYGF
jgi:hypothetical protein